MSLTTFVLRFIVYRLMWLREFSLIDRSLQTTLPILQLILVAFLTPALPYLIILFVKMTPPKKLALLVIVLFLYISIYSIPFWFDSAVILKGPLPPKPKLIAHRGLSYNYPENTFAAFNAVFSSYFLNSYSLKPDPSPLTIFLTLTLTL
jgi:hypothetical protein